MSKIKTEVSAGIIIFFKRGDVCEFLLLQDQNGKWNFPKGHIEKDETLKEAALREVKEEAGLNITDFVDGFYEKISYYFTKKYGDKNEKIYKIVHYFLAQSNSQKVKISNEHKNFAWLPYQKALQKIKYKNSKKLLKKAINFLKI